MSVVPNELTDQVALITGASSGIGEATAEALAANGASVALAARREDELADLADRIESDGGDALVIPTDVTDESQVETMVEAAHEESGRSIFSSTTPASCCSNESRTRTPGTSGRWPKSTCLA